MKSGVVNIDMVTPRDPDAGDLHHVTPTVAVQLRPVTARQPARAPLPVDPVYVLNKPAARPCETARPARETVQPRSFSFYRRSAEKENADPFVRRLSHLN